MKGIVKGEQNYIDKKKASQLKKTLLMFGIGALIFCLGLLLNKGEKANVFTIIAALMVLPAARYFVGYIVLFPYHSVEQDFYQEIKSKIPDADSWLCDLVITSSEKIMNLSFIVFNGKCAVGLTGRTKENAKEIESYLNHLLKASGYDCNVKICNEKNKFLKIIQTPQTDRLTEKELQEILSFLKTQMV